MKRYRVIQMDFDSTPYILSMNIDDSWEPTVQELHRKNKKESEQQLVDQYGILNSDIKLQNYIDLGAAPFSVIAFHNNFLRQIRGAFVIGAYYPALTGACTLGERILNHLIRALRDDYSDKPEYKLVRSRESFANWNMMTNVLSSWDILRLEAVGEFRSLEELRNRVIHFDPAVDGDARTPALEAIHILSRAIDLQFGAFGNHPWFIPNTLGACFIKKSAEKLPFIRKIYLPNCALVSPRHQIDLDLTEAGVQVSVIDSDTDGESDDNDEEFCRIFNQK